MVYQRTWFSYVLWFLFASLCIVLLAVDGGVWIQYFTGLVGTPLLIACCMVIPAAIGLYWIIRGIAAHIRKKYVWKERTVRTATGIFFILVIVCGVLIRIVCLNEYMSDRGSSYTISAKSMEYFEAAVVAEDDYVLPMDYGIEFLYVMLLSAVLTFLGNKAASAIYLQVFLQIISLVLVYAVTRKLARRLPACVSLLYLAFSLCSLHMLAVFGPEWLFFVLYMFGMLVMAGFVKNYCINRISKPLAVIGAVAIGALIGALTYLDITAASLLVMMLIVAVGKKSDSEATVYFNYSKGMNAAVILSSFLSCAAVWNGAMYAASYAKGTRFWTDITERLLICYRYSTPFTNIQPYFSDIYLVGLLIIPASFLIFEFFRNGKEQNYMPWILLCLVAAPTPLTTYGEHGFGVLSLFIWAVLAGLGLQNCLFGGRAKVMQAVIEEVNATAERTEASVSAEQTTETQEAKIGQAPKPRYIENPLPLPKKHVAREMDYQYDVADKDMKYDVFVSDNDDFDIK